jgi:DNA polymerase-1
MEKNKILLLDADVPCYQFAFKNQLDIDWDNNGEIDTVLHEDRVIPQLTKFIGSLKSKLKCSEVIIALSDNKSNFRKEILPSYKENRKQEKPKLWEFIRNYFESTEHGHRVEFRQNLEGDDILGILATHPKYKGKTVIATIDKDMNTIPGKLFLFNKPELGVVNVQPLDSIRYHMKQVLTGDTVDNYKGLKGVGQKTADKLLDSVDDIVEMWGEVVRLYESRGQTLDDAYVQARCAYILQYNDYIKGEIKPWTLQTALRNFKRS